jgi:hypothetical protein
MATDDTKPEGQAEVTLEGTTEPGSEPSPTATQEEIDPTSLLANLAPAPLPTEGVQETAGHMAAAVAVAAHRPPKATETRDDEPAVVLNTTQPLPVALPSAEPTVICARPPRAPQETTIPSIRVATMRRAWLAGAGILAVAAGVAASIVIASRTTSLAPAIATAASAASAAAPASVSLATAAATSIEAPAPVVNAISATASIATVVRPSPSAAPRAAPQASTARAASTPLAAPSAASPPRPASSGDFPWRQ